MRQVGGGHALAPLEPPQGINRDLGRLSPRLQPLTKERSHHTLELRSRGESRMNTGRGDGDGNEWPRRPAGTGGSPWTRRTGGFGEGTRARGPTMMKTSARRHSTYTPILYNNKTSRAPSCRITHAIDVNAVAAKPLTSPRPRASPRLRWLRQRPSTPGARPLARNTRRPAAPRAVSATRASRRRPMVKRTSSRP